MDVRGGCRLEEDRRQKYNNTQGLRGRSEMEQQHDLIEQNGVGHKGQDEGCVLTHGGVVGRLRRRRRKGGERREEALDQRSGREAHDTCQGAQTSGGRTSGQGDEDREARGKRGQTD